MAPRVGDLAPDFELPGTGGRTYRLSDFRGRPVVIAIYPGDNTAVCTRQLCSYRDAHDDFEGVDAQILGISPQDVDSHEEFARRQRFPFPLLADPDKRVIREYGAVGLGGLVKREIVLVDADGIVRYTHVGLGLTYRKPEELLAELAKLAPAGERARVQR
jgi:peroxiredoxin Q/BCP